MKTEETLITTTKKIYIADDGTPFDYLRDCHRYEKQSAAKKGMEKIQKSIKVGYGDFYGAWYYLKTREDFNALVTYIQEVHSDGCSVDTPKFDDKYLNDWMSFRTSPSSCSPDDCYFTTLREVKEEYNELIEALK